MTAAPPPSSNERDFEPGVVGNDPRLWLSALADGERAALPHATALWREDAQAREYWHLYHLVGDVLRSEDLASAPSRDAAFLATLREKLALEPVPLAPVALVASLANGSSAALGPLAPAVHAVAASRLGWRAPAAVAAGFAVVAVTLVFMRPGGFGAAESAVPLAAGSASVAGSGVRVVSNPLPSATGALVAEGYIRDPRLDAYLRAHQAARGNSPAALPGGGLRSVEILVTPPAVWAPVASQPASRAAASAARSAPHTAAEPR